MEFSFSFSRYWDGPDTSKCQHDPHTSVLGRDHFGSQSHTIVCFVKRVTRRPRNRREDEGKTYIDVSRRKTR
jgi:hypothetical protein